MTCLQPQVCYTIVHQRLQTVHERIRASLVAASCPFMRVGRSQQVAAMRICAHLAPMSSKSGSHDQRHKVSPLRL